MIRKIFYLLSLTIILTSCVSSFGIFKLEDKVKQLELGMLKQEVKDILGHKYKVVSAVVTPEGNLETYSYLAVDCLYYLHFLDGKLVEWYRDDSVSNVSPQPAVIAVGNIDHKYGRDRNASYTDDGFGNLTYENADGIRITVKRDILGNLNYNGENGKKASIKKDIFESRIYTDSKGNEIKYKKDVWNKEIERFKDDRIFLISLIKKYLYNF